MRMTGSTGEATVTASRRIEAPAGALFRLLADPARHLDLDGSGMLRGAVADAGLSGVGDVFVMRMHYEPYGDYEMRNHLVEFEPDRRIAWEPRPGRGHPDATAPAAAWGHRCAFDLHPDGPEATLVTETFDGSRLPRNRRAEVHSGQAWWRAQMGITLDRLATLCGAP
jgi:hypothetical protein